MTACNPWTVQVTIDSPADVLSCMPHTKNRRFNVNAFMKARKEARERAVQECRSLQGEINRNMRKINRLKSKVCGMFAFIFLIVALQCTLFKLKLLF